MMRTFKLLENEADEIHALIFAFIGDFGRWSWELNIEIFAKIPERQNLSRMHFHKKKVF